MPGDDRHEVNDSARSRTGTTSALFDFAFPAVPEELGGSRARLRAWLQEHIVASEVAQDVLVAAGEACSNSIEHSGGGARPGAVTVRLTARIAGSTLILLVTDNGRWRSPSPTPDSYRGRGLIMMEALTDQLTIRAGPHGTTVEMRVELPPDS